MLHKILAYIIKFKYFLYKIRKFIYKKISDKKEDDSTYFKTVHVTIWCKIRILRLIKSK